MSTRNIWTEDPYVYRSDENGLYVYDLASEALVGFLAVTGGVSSVWADENYFYFGTSVSGVFRGDVATVSGTPTATQYKSYPDLLSYNVNYLHGKGDYLCIATESGIDRYNVSTDDRYYEVASSPAKCWQTTEGSFYYIVNPEDAIIGLSGRVLDWLYSKKITLDFPIPYDNYSYYFEIPREEPHDIVRRSKPNGEDVRVIDDQGRPVPLWVEHWNSVDNPRLWVKLYAGTEELIVLYGGIGAVSVSDPDSVFLLYDNFDGNVLDEDKWTWVPDYVNNEYHIEDSIIQIVSKANNYYPRIVSKDYFSLCTVEARLRAEPGAGNYSDFDPHFGFTDGGVWARIGTEDAGNVYEHAHTLYSQSDWGDIEGDKLMSTQFLNLTVVESLYHQSSTYDDETLVSSGTLTDPQPRRVRFSISNTSINPELEIDWVRVRLSDPSGINPPGYTFAASDYTYNWAAYSELHAVYGSTVSGSFVYTAHPDNILNSLYIHDIYVTENTSEYGGNVLFLGTNYGAQVVEERRGDELNCRTRLYLIDS